MTFADLAIGDTFRFDGQHESMNADAWRKVSPRSFVHAVWSYYPRTQVRSVHRRVTKHATQEH